jgi:hypothetical protein
MQEILGKTKTFKLTDIKRGTSDSARLENFNEI